MSPPLVIRTEPIRDVGHQAAALALYEKVWKFVPPGIARASRWGSEWFDMTTPTCAYDGANMVAHVGQATCDLQIAGQPEKVAALHAVCVDPAYRGRGLGRAVLEAALHRLDGMGVERVILWSEKTALYNKFGFEPVDEYVFRCPAPPPAKIQSRPLDPDVPHDLAVLHDKLCHRVPVSAGHAAVDTGWHFLIDLGLANPPVGTLRFLPGRDAIVVGARAKPPNQHTLQIDDVVGRHLPSLAEIVGAFSEPSDPPITMVQLHVSSDQLAPQATAVTHPQCDRLHVRGSPLPVWGSGRFALSPFTRT